MPAAAMSAAAVTVAVRVSVARAIRVRVEDQRSGKERGDRLVRGTRHPAVERNMRVLERRTRATADTAANQRRDLLRLQKTRKGAMTLPVRRDHFRTGDLTVLNVVNLKERAVPEMLEHRAVVIWNCDFHDSSLLYVGLEIAGTDARQDVRRRPAPRGCETLLRPLMTDDSRRRARFYVLLSIFKTPRQVARTL